MELQIHVRRARAFLFHSLSLGSASLDADALELRVQCTIKGELRSSGSGKRGNAKSKNADGYIWRQDSGVIKWYLTTKELKALKSKAPTLKLYVFGIGDEVHSLGWFFMDLRTPDTALRWIKLVNSKYSGEIHVSSQLRKAPSFPSIPPPPPQQHDLPVVPPTTTGEDDCLDIRDHPDAIYVLSIVVEGATHMGPMVEALLKRCSPLELHAILAKGFWLSYSIFDVVVQTDVFHTLDVAGFDVIRDSFRLKSSLPALAALFTDMAVLPIFLCTVDRILCRTEIPVANWLPSTDLGSISASSPELRTTPPALQLKGPYPFLASHETKDVSPLGQVQASLDLVVESHLVYATTGTSSLDEDVSKLNDTPFISFLYLTLQHELPTLPSAVVQFHGHQERIVFDTHQQQEHGGGVVAHTGRFADGTTLLLEESSAVASSKTAVLLSVAVDGHQVATADIPTHPIRVLSPVGNQPHVAILRNAQGVAVGEVGYECPTEPSRTDAAKLVRGGYSLQLDVVSIKATAAAAWPSDETVVYVQFPHPFYTGPTVTSEGVLLSENTAEHDLTGLSNMRFDRLSSAHLQLPVMFHVLVKSSKSASTTDDPPICVGHALLSLQYLMHATLSYECDVCGDTMSDWTTHANHLDDVGGRTTTLYKPFTTCDVYVPVMEATPVAILHVRAKWTHPERLSDEASLPPIEATPQHVPTSRTPVDQSCISKEQPLDDNSHSLHLHPIQAESPANPVVDHTKQQPVITLQRERVQFTAEKKAWEIWKRKQQTALDQAEAKRMDALEAEWSLREKGRLQTVRDAQQEYMGLEKKLRQTLHDLDVRERSLTKAEEALQHKLTVQKQEMDIVSRKSKSETQHAMSLVEQQKQSSDLIRQQMEDRAIRAELQLKQLQGDLVALRVEQRKSPENVLRQDIIQYQATIATLEKQMRLLQLEKDKEVQVQKELGVQVDRLTQLLHQEKRHQDELKVQEVEALRLKYIAREERFVLDGDRQELKAIKKQLDVLRQVQFSQNKELARLQKEKAELLATGQYTEDSFVIQELSRLIAAKQP